jgi:hypothetical protein
MGNKNKLLIVAVAICFVFSASRIYDFYLSQQSPFAVGECFLLETGEVTFQGKVVNNDNKKKASDVEFEFKLGPGMNVKIFKTITYQKLKDANLKKVKCDETLN